ncbi:MAG: hypothetical protein ACRBG0_26875 [Lewinella sp.]|uniref:hypothetical protein n=1 Tax=Lewinella sp. TaxID=2004506 RepID=UPI003D6AE17B
MVYLKLAIQWIVDVQVRWPFLLYFPIFLCVAEGNILCKFVLLFLGFLINFYYNLIPYYLSQYFHTRASYNFISQYKDCTFIQHDISEYINANAVKFNLDNYLERKKSSIKSWYEDNIKENTYFFEVKRNKAKEFPKNAKVFTGEFGTVVFVPDSPEGMRPFTRFKLLHEFFHSSEISLFFERQLVFKNTLFILSFIFFFLNIEISLLSFFVALFVFALILFEARYYWAVRKYDSLLLAEVMSDILAVKYLNETERKSIKESPYIDHLIGDDVNLGVSQNKARKENFVDIIKSGVDNEDIIDIMNTSYSPPNDRVNFLIFMLICGSCFLAREVTWYLVLWNAVVFVALLITSMVIVRGAYTYYKDEFERIFKVNLTQEDYFKYINSPNDT